VNKPGGAAFFEEKSSQSQSSSGSDVVEMDTCTTRLKACLLEEAVLLIR
jgi:hypothetical protein